MEKIFEPLEGRNLEIIETVMGCPEVLPLPEDMKFKIRLCVEEVEENILCYSGSTWIKLDVVNNGESLKISFTDGGVEFDPLAKKDPDITASVEDRAIGGLGIFICKNMMDELSYHFVNGCNTFTMIMNLNK